MEIFETKQQFTGLINVFVLCLVLYFGLNKFGNLRITSNYNLMNPCFHLLSLCALTFLQDQV